MEEKKAQTSLEFLYAVGMSLLVFTIAALLFLQSQQDSTAMSAYANSRLVCQSVASRISAVAAAGDGASTYFSLPLVAGGTNYVIFVSGKNSTVSVSYSGAGTACRFSTTNVSNGNSSSFYVTNNTVIRNVDGGVLFG